MGLDDRLAGIVIARAWCHRRLTLATSAPSRIAVMILVIGCMTWFALLCVITSLTYGRFLIDQDSYLLPILYGLHAQTWALDQRLLAPIPSYFYFWLYSFLPPHNILSAARCLNAGFIAAAGLPAYAVARRYLTPAFAVAFAIFVISCPNSSYVRYVIPEPAYLFGFWLILLGMLSAVNRSPLLAALLSGSLIGMLSLIKPHALALALGSSLFLLIRGRTRVNSAVCAIAVLLSYYSIRIVLAYLLTGRWLLSVAGSSYGAILRDGFHIDLWATAVNTFGHICAVGILIGLPLTITIALVSRQSFERTEDINPAIDRISDLGLLACCMLAATISMTIYFSQSAYQLNPLVERITRLHGRYYDFVLPLFILVTISLWQNKYDLTKLCERWVIIALSVAAFAAAIIIIHAFNANYIDFPDLALAVVGTRHAKVVLMTLVFAPFVLACFDRTRVGTANLIFYATLSCCLLSVSATAAITKYYGITYAPNDPVDLAFLKSRGKADLNSLAGRAGGLIAAVPGDFDVYRALFYLHSLTPVLVSTVIRDADFTEETQWAVLLPGVHYSGASPTTQAGALTIIWRQEPRALSDKAHPASTRPSLVLAPQKPEL